MGKNAKLNRELAKLSMALSREIFTIISATR